MQEQPGRVTIWKKNSFCKGIDDILKKDIDQYELSELFRERCILPAGQDDGTVNFNG